MVRSNNYFFSFGVALSLFWLAVGMFFAPMPTYELLIIVPSDVSERKLPSRYDIEPLIEVKFSDKWYVIDGTQKRSVVEREISVGKPVKVLILKNAIYSPFDHTSPHFSPFIVSVGNFEKMSPLKWTYYSSNIVAVPLGWAIVLILVEVLVFLPMRKLMKVGVTFVHKFEYLMFGSVLVSFSLGIINLPISGLLLLVD